MTAKVVCVRVRNVEIVAERKELRIRDYIYSRNTYSEEFRY